MPEISKKTLEARLEAILFAAGDAVSLAELSAILEVSEEELGMVIDRLDSLYRQSDRGLSLIGKDDRILLATHPDCADTVERFLRREREGPLSRAALETLALVAYRGPIARSEIESIRGVNSTLSLRTLLLRGLVERRGNPEDSRGYLYTVAFSFLEALGVGDISELPDFETLSRDGRLMPIDGEADPSEQEDVSRKNEEK